MRQYRPAFVLNATAGRQPSDYRPVVRKPFSISAEPLLQRALAIYEQERGPMHPTTALVLQNLGGLYQVQGKYAEAEEALQRSLAIAEKLQETRLMA